MQSTELETSNLPESRMNVFKPPYDDHDHELHPSCPVQAVMPHRPIAVMMEMSSFSSV
ncbi:hypothetical protein AZE42_05638 [Rhizopogon vesiculosus]|uniref:Uncharacterized protein n=1 Tax=Rhizopogon vesiculosus TaxID=180088 RepID=A0A1J8RE07_9AGAM|nr:hypothetical protein AZE42_05638 [Rhizopogon vesiculosus]